MRIRSLPEWKRALIFSSLGVGVALAFSGRRLAGAAVAGVGVGMLVSENREILGKIASDMPRYLENTSRVMQIAASIGERVAAARTSARS